jgi:outer membrane lipoprotein SlyB
MGKRGTKAMSGSEMKSLRQTAGVLGAVALMGALGLRDVAFAEERLFVYPAAGQSESQLADDRYACHVQALQASGFDPTRAAMVSRATPARAVVKVPPNESEGATGKGMIAGAVAGAVIGAATGDDAGRGAVAGAAVGTLIGNSVERKGAEAAEAQAQAEGEQKLRDSDAEAARLADQRARYKTAFGQCLEERGYTVR